MIKQRKKYMFFSLNIFIFIIRYTLDLNMERYTFLLTNHSHLVMLIKFQDNGKFLKSIHHAQ